MVTRTKKPLPVRAAAVPAKKGIVNKTGTTLRQRVAKKARLVKPISKTTPAAKRPTAKTTTQATSHVARDFPLNEFAHAKPASEDKPKKTKLVRDSFSIPRAEYVIFKSLKTRAANFVKPAKKNELLRAGIKTLAALSDAEFLKALEETRS